MAAWFDGSCDLDCDMDAIGNAAGGGGEYLTREGTMERTAVSVSVNESNATIDCDERYQAGKRAAYRSHLNHVFSKTPDGVSLRSVISDVIAPGFLGPMYGLLASRSIGNAFQLAIRTYFSGTDRIARANRRGR